MKALHELAVSALVLATPVQSEDALGLANGYATFQTGDFKGQIVQDSQTLASLTSADSGYDFLPYDLISNLSINGAHSLGDVTVRYRTSNASSWISVDSASVRKPVTPLENYTDSIITASDLEPTLGNTSMPFMITREWITTGSDLGLRINLTNKASSAVEIGSLGLPISINNIFTNRPALETEQRCSFADPYIGLDAGYVRVSPLQGTGHALVITALGSSPFEAWRFLSEPEGSYYYQSQTYEGTYEWQIHSLAYAENEWNSSVPWNTPTSKILQPGQTYSVGLRFALAEDIPGIEEIVVKSGTPLAVGIPGYIVPQDMTARLYLNHTAPVASIESDDDALIIIAPETPDAPYLLTPASSTWGRSRLTIHYADSKIQTIHYYITKPFQTTLSDLGTALTTHALFNDTSDPFHRAPSIMTYDHEAQALVTQEGRVWIAGLSDEGGTGAYVATALKQFIQPVAEEISIIDAFVHETLVGTLQQNGSLSVVLSAFFYEPDAVADEGYVYDARYDWTQWSAYNRSHAFTTRRAYNYIHPVSVYWALYRIARSHPDLELRAAWNWYLSRAYDTTMYCLGNEAANCDYGDAGLMGETVLGELLEDLKREGMGEQVEALEGAMRWRAELWDKLDVPFGSEMAWDSTGQEGVWYWCNYFNLTHTTTKALSSILAYTPAVAHWGWNGNARRYWDFAVTAKIAQIERQIHHYGSALNSLPLLQHYQQQIQQQVSVPSNSNGSSSFSGPSAGEDDPESLLYILRLAHAANTAPLTSISSVGFPSAAFHSFPDLLKWDPYTADYGPGFLGMALGQCMYIVPSQGGFEDMVFGGEIVSGEGGSNGTEGLHVEPRDGVRRRVFVAEVGLKVEISAGILGKVIWNGKDNELKLLVSRQAAEGALRARSVVVWMTDPEGKGHESGWVVVGGTVERGGWDIELEEGETTVVVQRAAKG